MTLGNDNGTDGQTDGRTDRVRRIMRPPPREEGRIIIMAWQSGKALCWDVTVTCPFNRFVRSWSRL